jgi:phosphohistidine phosphatase
MQPLLRLTLVRHAKTEPQADDQEDWDRPLAPRGERDAPEMARRLKARKLKPDRLISSPALRAISTARLMVKEWGVAAGKIELDERLYLGSPKIMLEVVRELGGDTQHLMLFGHNPGITEFADQLSRERAIDNMPTCAYYTLQFDLKDWRALDWRSGVNEAFDYPKNS